MALSGLAAFIVPEGKIAFWTHCSFLGLAKAQWGAIAEKLVKNGCALRPDETLKDGAARLKMNPIEILTVILIDEPA